MSTNGTKVYSRLVAHKAVAVPAVGAPAGIVPVLARDMVRLQHSMAELLNGVAVGLMVW